MDQPPHLQRPSLYGRTCKAVHQPSRTDTLCTPCPAGRGAGGGGGGRVGRVGRKGGEGGEEGGIQEGLAW